MISWLSPETLATLMLFCALVFTLACSLFALVGVFYLSCRLVFALLGEVERYKFRRASVKIRQTEAARLQAQ